MWHGAVWEGRTLIVELERRVAGLPSTKGGERLQRYGERTGSRNAGQADQGVRGPLNVVDRYSSVRA